MLLRDCNENRPYELLLRWDEHSGELKGAAFYERKITVMGGELIRNELLDPVAVDLGSPALSALFDKAAASAMAAVLRLRADLDARDATAVELNDTVSRLTANLAGCEADVSERDAMNASLRAELQAAHMRIAELEAAAAVL